MTLDQYLAETGETETTFGARVGLSQPTINRLRRGISKPSWGAVAAIEKASGGKVQPNDWREPVAGAA